MRTVYGVVYSDPGGIYIHRGVLYETTDEALKHHAELDEYDRSRFEIEPFSILSSFQEFLDIDADDFAQYEAERKAAEKA